MTAADREMIERFKIAFVRWNAHRGGELHDSCPICRALVIIRPRVAPGATDGVFDASHAEPVCDEFMLLMVGMGAGDLRMSTRRVS